MARGKSRINRALAVMAGVGGAAVAYFFDPDRGKARRAKVTDKIYSVTKRTGTRTEKKARYTAGRAEGLRHKLTGTPQKAGQEIDDKTLEEKVRSEIFQGLGEIDSGRVNVNAESGVIILRGQLNERDHISALAERARNVMGVRDVVNLLHLPGEEPPNKEAALEAGRSTPTE